MNKVRLSPAARQDLRDIREYISRDLKNPIAAASVTDRIVKRLRVLEQFGEAGPSVEALTGAAADLRMLNCGDYIAFYRVEEHTVSVARILNGRQDYLRVLFGTTELP